MAVSVRGADGLWLRVVHRFFLAAATRPPSKETDGEVFTTGAGRLTRRGIKNLITIRDQQNRTWIVEKRNEPRLQHHQSAAQEKLDAHTREIIQWHFSPETGGPFWLEWAKKAGWNPLTEVKSFADIKRFPHFQDEWLRDLQNEVWVPRKFAGRPFNIFETGGTTSHAPQHWPHRVEDSWQDEIEKSFLKSFPTTAFPRNHRYWT